MKTKKKSKREPSLKNETSATTDDEVACKSELKLQKPQAPTKKSKKKIKKELRTIELQDKTLSKYRLGALEYLNTWKHNNCNWKFSKNIQNWILAHLYDEEFIPKDVWMIILEYFQSSKGLVKVNLLNLATKIVEDDNVEKGIKYERARDIVQNIDK